MAKVKKLPSGNWRVQVFDYKDADGKRHYRSFTGATRREAEFMAAEWNATRPDQENTFESFTLNDAVAKYIDMKRSVLSPSTIREYVRMQKNYFQEIGQLRLADLNSTNVQIWISGLASRLSPKSVKNIYGLFISTFNMFLPDSSLNITLPARIKPDLYTPSDQDVQVLLDHIKGTELEIAVMLAAFGPMRRSEICALTSDDIKGNTVYVRHGVVSDENKNWCTKQPKSYGGYREIEFPSFVIDRIKGIEGRIVKATPDQITNRFARAVKYSKLQHFRFHDLRHYAASIMHAIGVPDQYILRRGGWSSDQVMKTVYRNVIDIENAKQTKKIVSHFDSMQHEMQHDTRKA